MTAASGAVYDRGYRPYAGQRLGRSGARRALFRAGVRRALGLRRSWRQKVLPWLLLITVTIPAVVNVGIGYLTRDSPLEGFEFFSFRDYVGVSTALLLFVALTAPDLICPDRQYRMLSLVLSRPLTGIDYLVAKIGAIFTVVFAFGYIPQVVLFVGQMLVADGAIDFTRDNAGVLWQAPLSVAIVAFYLSVIGVTIASLTTRKVIAAAIFAGGMLVSTTVANVILGEAPRDPSAWELLDLWTLPLKLRDIVFLGELSGDTALSGVAGGAAMAVAAYVAIVGACLVVLWRRYRTVDA